MTECYGIFTEQIMIAPLKNKWQNVMAFLKCKSQHVMAFLQCKSRLHHWKTNYSMLWNFFLAFIKFFRSKQRSAHHQKFIWKLWKSISPVPVSQFEKLLTFCGPEIMNNIYVSTKLSNSKILVMTNMTLWR